MRTQRLEPSQNLQTLARSQRKVVLGMLSADSTVNLEPPPHSKGTMQEQNLAFLARLNREHLARHPGESDLEARIASCELAARMQTVAKEALDLSGETEATKKLYGLDDPITREYGTRCLIARRLVERGVRFVQLFVNGQIWDNHESIKTSLANCCRKTDQPSAAPIVHPGGDIPATA